MRSQTVRHDWATKHRIRDKWNTGCLMFTRHKVQKKFSLNYQLKHKSWCDPTHEANQPNPMNTDQCTPEECRSGNTCPGMPLIGTSEHLQIDMAPSRGQDLEADQGPRSWPLSYPQLHILMQSLDNCMAVLPLTNSPQVQRRLWHSDALLERGGEWGKTTTILKPILPKRAN